MTGLLPISLSTETWKKLAILFVAAFLVRAGTFYFYVQHEERYRQADSTDYHTCGLSIARHNGMHRVDNNKPIFWRTPGYPAFLAPFYAALHGHTSRFSDNTRAQKTAIWAQIFLCSLTPLLIFFLTLMLTQQLTIAWILALIFTFHLGFVLASCYLLTDALSMLFFYLFLIFLYGSFSWFKPHEGPPSNMFWYIVGAALSLGIFTWMRPNGQFVAWLAVLLLLFCTCPWKTKLLKIVLFLGVFFASIAPWYLRNQKLTGHLFFCPMSGPYLVTFNAPKILRRITGKPLDQCIKYLLSNVGQELKRQQELSKLIAPGTVVSQELVCAEIAVPWIKKYPGYFILDWMQEVCKTTFDLYSSQLVAFASKTYTYDPIEEFLSEKLKLCIYKQPMGWWMRLLCWFELLFSLFVWVGLLAGAVVFIGIPLISWVTHSQSLEPTTYLWLKLGIMIGGIVGMTGGFGYARLRMPVEPLMIILAILFWLWVYEKSHKKAKFA